MIECILAAVLAFMPVHLEPVQMQAVNNPETLTEHLKQEDAYKEMLAWTVQQEVGGLHSLEATEAVIDVVYNRLESPEYPDTIPEVLTPDQFNGVSNYYTRTNPPDETVYTAIDSIGTYRGISNSAFYFCSYDDLDGQAKEWFDSLTLTTEIDGVRFYR